MNETYSNNRAFGLHKLTLKIDRLFYLLDYWFAVSKTSGLKDFIHRELVFYHCFI